MRIIFIISIFIVGFAFLSFNYPLCKSTPLNNISNDCDSIPELNNRVLDFVKSKIKKKVGRGECWDLAAEALDLIGAKWNGKYIYGREVFYEKECVFPGDIIQFEGVKIQYEKDGVTYKEKMAHHTAIVYEVKSKGSFILAHQNTGFSGKKVGLSPLDLQNITKGKIKIYRPFK